MKITELKSGIQLNTLPRVSLALGSFDGVHAGHRKVIERAVSYARKNGCSSAVWCFSDSERLNKGALLSDNEEKAEIFRSLGADLVIFESFEAVRNMSCELFVTDYLKKLSAQAVFCGFNFRFGKGAEGNTALLCELCRSCDILCDCVPAVTDSDIPVSSTAIRTLISEGEVEKAEKLLCRPYSITSKVTHGRHLGASLGFPTVNQSFENGKAVPKNAVYLTLTRIDGRVYPSVSNVGARPTVNGKHLRLETHILDFDGDLYGKKITVEFKKFRRDEIKFSSEAQLKEAVLADIDAAAKYFSEKEDL